MNMTSSRRMSRHNRTRALIRIQKELGYIAQKTKPGTQVEKDVREALRKVVDAIQATPEEHGDEGG